MAGISSAEITVEVFDRPSAMPDEAQALLAEADDLFASRTWWDLVLAHAMPPARGHVRRLPSGRTACCWSRRCCAPARAVALASLTTPYTCLYTPSSPPVWTSVPGSMPCSRWRGSAAPPASHGSTHCRPNGTDLGALERGARRAGLRALPLRPLRQLA